MKRLLLLLLPLFALTASGQNDETLYRLELGGGIGFGTGHTDLKGKWAADMAAIARFPLNPRMAVKTQLSYLNLKGSTEGQKNFYPALPDTPGTDRLAYSVSDAVIDASALYELHCLPYGYLRDYKGHCRLVPYLQMGFELT